MILFFYLHISFILIVDFIHSNDDRVYALKQIEGSGISMSACREIAVSLKMISNIFKYSFIYLY